jgi:hypothetical protein
MSAMEQGQEHRQNFFPLMGRHLSALYHFVRHQLAYLQATGDLLRDELSAEDDVDAVAARAYQEFPHAPSGRALRPALIRLAREQIDTEVARLVSWRAREPDEDLKVEDVIVEGLQGDDLARALGRPKDVSDRMLEHARAYLRERLTEAACLPPS